VCVQDMLVKSSDGLLTGNVNRVEGRTAAVFGDGLYDLVALVLVSACDNDSPALFRKVFGCFFPMPVVAPTIRQVLLVVMMNCIYVACGLSKESSSQVWMCEVIYTLDSAQVGRESLVKHVLTMQIYEIRLTG